MKKSLLLLGIVFAGIYFILALKNPYSSRSLVPNLEPYPDTLFYSTPAWNFAHGKGFVMQAFDYQSRIIPPPIYSLYLIPFFAAFNDVRSFYFANIALGFGSLLLFLLCAYRLLYRKISDLLIIAVIAVFFVTNFYIYTLPTLLMAENITLFISLCGLYLLITPLTKRGALLAGLLGVSMSLIKFSNAPLTITFYCLYGYRVFKSKSKKKVISSFLLSTGFAILVLALYLSMTKILVGHKNLSAGISFSPEHFTLNFMPYLKILVGQPERFLWFQNNLISPVVALVSLIGMGIGLWTTTLRKNSLYLLIYGLGTLVFMSFFYLRDIRYILTIYPLMLIFAGVTFIFVKNRFGTAATIVLMILVTGAYLLVPGFGYIPGERAIITFKKQVGLNLRHAETPWNYNATQEFNAYFAKNPSKKEKPYLATFLPPYYVNYYSQGDYKYLPLSMGQEFFREKQNAPKVFLISLEEYYRNLLAEGHEIYISPYYKGNLRSWEKDYNDLTKKFHLELVRKGCFDTCNIYKLSL